MKRNLTIQLDDVTVQQARAVAAKRATSISALVREQIKQLADQDSAYQQAKAKAFYAMDHPFNSGGVQPYSRDELHER